MICPYCGAEATPGRCPVCQVEFRPASGSVTASVTAFGTPSSADDAPTMFGEGVTGVGSLPPPRQSNRGRAASSPPYASSSARPASSPSSGGPGGPLAPGEAFGSRYHIIRLLGIGGMGAVYQAWDAELGVAVALKVIRPEATRGSRGRRELERRFKQELLLARQVTHKNVVRIHDLGEIDGIKYITMPYVEGDDLGNVLETRASCRLPRRCGSRVAIASGLVAAHDAGVVHRDLKPANIMIDASGDALIMDFGIARSTGDAADRRDRRAEVCPPRACTTPAVRPTPRCAGAVVGTVEYMAPEQARGEAVDQRADIYAFGLILYDMLLGSRRARRDAAQRRSPS